MVVIYCAYTEQVNPSGATPVLTRDQIWQGLERKTRQAQDFVPVITGTDVEEDKDNVVTRVAHFKAMNGNPASSVREVCKSYYPVKVDYWNEENGALITNTVSDGPSLTESDYNLTFTFEWKHPEVEEGGEKHKELIEMYTKGGKQAVHGTIEAMRKFAAAGKLG